jgi:hypothetical protein
MAVYKIFPFKDTTLYSFYPDMNTGIDPINQISNLNFALDTYPQVARTILSFDSTEIADTIENVIQHSSSFEARLMLLVHIIPLIVFKEEVLGIQVQLHTILLI